MLDSVPVEVFFAVAALFTVVGSVFTYICVSMAKAQERNRAHEECNQRLAAQHRQLVPRRSS